MHHILLCLETQYYFVLLCENLSHKNVLHCSKLWREFAALKIYQVIICSVNNFSFKNFPLENLSSTRIYRTIYIVVR